MNGKSSLHFPNPALSTNGEGMIINGGNIDGPTLYSAYKLGIFPWPRPNESTLWFCPLKRGILDLNEFHISKSFKKFLKKCNWEITFNQEFFKVITNCKEISRPNQTFTWITPQIVQGYTELHKMGMAYSVECWENGELIGGLYGTMIHGVFSAESMFFYKSQASKLCLYALIDCLQGNQISWLDIQIVSNYMKNVGGKLIDRENFLSRVSLAQQNNSLFIWPKKWNVIHKPKTDKKN